MSVLAFWENGNFLLFVLLIYLWPSLIGIFGYTTAVFVVSLSNREFSGLGIAALFTLIPAVGLQVVWLLILFSLN